MAVAQCKSDQQAERKQIILNPEARRAVAFFVSDESLLQFPDKAICLSRASLLDHFLIDLHLAKEPKDVCEHQSRVNEHKCFWFGPVPLQGK